MKSSLVVDCDTYTLMQITSQGINLVHATTLALSGQWNPPASNTINVAACNPHQVLVSYGGNTLVYLEIQGQELKEIRYKRKRGKSGVGINYV